MEKVSWRFEHHYARSCGERLEQGLDDRTTAANTDEVGTAYRQVRTRRKKIELPTKIVVPRVTDPSATFRIQYHLPCTQAHPRRVELLVIFSTFVYMYTTHSKVRSTVTLGPPSHDLPKNTGALVPHTWWPLPRTRRLPDSAANCFHQVSDCHIIPETQQEG